MNKGLYIMLEGGEGCGKDSHADALQEYLEHLGREVIRTKEPDGQISKILKDKANDWSPLTEFFLFLAHRTDNYEKDVRPNLCAGRDVLKTRGWPSSEAYQGYAGNLDLDFIRDQDRIATQGITPDILFILDVNASKGLEKEVNPDRFAAKGLSYHEKVNQGYREIAEEYSHFAVLIPYIENGFDEMQNQIRREVDKKLRILD